MVKLLTILILFGLSGLLPLPVFAHVVKSDGTVGAVIHIDPEDDPVAGGENTIYLEFKDTTGKFNLPDCDCKLTISKDSQEVSSQSFSSTSESEPLSAVIPFVFPEKGIYEVKISGASKTSDFPNFVFTYDVRVARDNNSTPAPKESWFSEHVIHLIGSFGIVAFFIGALIAQKRRKLAVIVLTFLLVFHSIPVKAIHASHQADFNGEAYHCCLPVAADLPITTTPEIIFISFFKSPPQLVVFPVEQLQQLFFTRPPPNF